MKDLPGALFADRAQGEATPARPRRWAVWGGLLLTMGLVVAVLSWRGAEPAAAPAATPVFTDWAFNPFAKGAPLDAVQYNADAQREADAARARVLKVWESGSLRGSDLDGDWGEWKDQQLQPSSSLRRRFDYLLTALGEVAAGDLRHWVEQEVSVALGSSGAARQVLAVWDRYISLQQTAFTTRADPHDAATWQPALAERTAARQWILGGDWARAFYGDEEQAFAAFSEQLAAQRSGAAAPPDVQAALLSAPGPALTAEQAGQLHALRVQQFGAEAAERLRDEDAQWASWEQRLQAARERIQAIATAPELSAPQRIQAQRDHLAQAFSGNELVRAQALLGIAP